MCLIVPDWFFPWKRFLDPLWFSESPNKLQLQLKIRLHSQGWIGRSDPVPIVLHPKLYIYTGADLERATPGGYKGMSSILADQKRPRIWAQMRGGGLRGLSPWVQLNTGAQINFGYLTPFLKVPKCEIFDPFYFTPINPIWVGDLRTGDWTADIRHFVFFAHA